MTQPTKCCSKCAPTFPRYCGKCPCHSPSSGAEWERSFDETLAPLMAVNIRNATKDFIKSLLEKAKQEGREEAVAKVNDWLDNVGRSLSGQLQDFKVVNVKSLRRELEAARTLPTEPTTE